MGPFRRPFRADAVLRSGPARALLVGALVLLAFAWLYLPVHSAWWRWDDPQILKQALSFGPLSYFFDPEAWRTLSAAHLTPWGTASFALDHGLFGLSPRRFYLHQVLGILAAAALLYAVARQWFRPEAALAAPVLFLAAAPASILAEQLMTRHYVDGLVFALAALFLFVRSVRAESLPLAILAAFAYALALASKELYAPLLLAVLVVPDRSWRARLCSAFPLALVAGLYVLWRFYMLGVPVGGYGRPVSAAELLALPFGALSYLLGALGASIALSLLSLSWLRSLAAGGCYRLPVILGGALLPLAPVAHGVVADLHDLHSPRYLTVVAALVALGCAWLVSRLTRRWPVWIALVLVLTPALLFVLPRSLEARAAVADAAAELERQGQFLAHAREPLVFWPDLGGFHHYLTGLQAIGLGAMVELAADEQDVAELTRHKLPVWRYDAGCRCIERLTDPAAALAPWRRRVRMESLSVRFSADGKGLVSWDFGPYTDGRYFVINRQRFGRLALPPVGQLRTGLRQFSVVVRYDSPQGWSTYSDVLQLDLSEPASVRFDRPKLPYSPQPSPQLPTTDPPR